MISKILTNVPRLNESFARTYAQVHLGRMFVSKYNVSEYMKAALLNFELVKI